MNRSARSVNQKEVAKKMTERAARAEKVAKLWDNHPLFKGQLSAIKDATKRQNEAINLTNQARYMKKLTEAETSAEFQKMAPANMMRLVQLTMTNLNRGNVFSEYAMETARDTIYYVKPYFSKSVAASSGNFAERSMSYDAANADKDPYGFDSKEELGVGGYNGNFPAYGGKKQAYNGAVNTNARKSIYESSESRFANELANTSNVKIDGNTITIEWKGGPFGENGEKYVPGSSKIYVGTDERDVIAYQDPNTLEYLVAQEFAGATVTEAPRAADGSNVVTVTIDLSGVTVDGFTTPTSVNAYGRFESEGDYEGTTLGEVELLMTPYELRPHRTSIGVSWTTLTEVTLDSTFNTQVDDLLLTAAADTIHSQLDLQAFKEAYTIARTNPEIYKIEFDAGYSTVETKTGEDGVVTSQGTKDSYIETANTFTSAIALAGAALYSDIHRGSIDKLVVGVSVAPYIKLMAGYAPKGLQEATGVYKVGELDGIEVYVAPIEVLPDNEVLCVHKNSKVVNDVALLYGTLVPFVSKKLEYPTFYTRAGLATFGDRAILNPKYLSRIVIKNLKDRVNAKAYAKMAGF